MNRLKYFALAAVVGFCFTVAAPKMQAQVSIGINIGAAPACPYGYYDTAPYGCAPYGYYGAEWYSGGEFVGAGPWFHGSDNFQGHVNNRYHPEHGYKGAMPKAGDKADSRRHIEKDFKGNEVRDGRGHTGGDKH